MNAFLRHFEQWIAGALIAMLFVLVLVDVTTRNVLGTSLVWPEEISRILFLWAIFIGAAAALRANALITIDVVYRYLGARGRRRLDAVVFVVVAVCLGILLWQGCVFFARFARDVTPTTGIAKGYFYGAVPVGALLMLGRLVQWFVGRRRSNGDGPSPAALKVQA